MEKKEIKFEAISNEVILLIMEHCDVKTMVRLSQTNKRYNNLMGKTKKLMNRINLRMRLGKVNKDESWKIISFAKLEAIFKSIMSNQRKYQKLEVFVPPKTSQSYKRFDLLLLDIIETIGSTIKDFKYWTHDGSFKNDIVQILLAIPNAEKLSILYHYDVDNAIATEIPIDVQQLQRKQFNFMANLKDLMIINYDGDILKLFRCKQIERLNAVFTFRSQEQLKLIDNFLAQQKQLKTLDLFLSWKSSLRCDLNWPAYEFKLTSLSLNKVPLPPKEFFAKQDQIEELFVTIKTGNFRDPLPFYDAMQSIFGLKKLEKLKILCHDYHSDAYETLPEWFFHNLRNDTVKKVKFIWPQQNFIRVANLLHEAEKVAIHAESLDLSRVRLDVIEKSVIVCQDELVYAPPEVPPDREYFERVFAKCVEQIDVTGDVPSTLRIGHINWSNHLEFQLTLQFIINLVEHLPHLENLELSNVHECQEQLEEYLIAERPETTIILNGEVESDVEMESESDTDEVEMIEDDDD